MSVSRIGILNNRVFKHVRRVTASAFMVAAVSSGVYAQSAGTNGKDTIILTKYKTQYIDKNVLKSIEPTRDTVVISKPEGAQTFTIKSFEEKLKSYLYDFKSTTPADTSQKPSQKFKDITILPEGIPASEGVEFPSNNITVNGQNIKARVVVDVTKNVLYYYDTEGSPNMAYLVASGKKSTPTSCGIRRVTHIETYPYKTAAATTKRRKSPGAYGPKIICLTVVNPQTGESVGANGEFIHGNNKPSSIGQHASKGCIRMDNEAVKYLSSVIKRNDYVVIKK